MLQVGIFAYLMPDLETVLQGWPGGHRYSSVMVLLTIHTYLNHFIFILEKPNFVFHLFSVNLIDFVWLIQNLFLKYIYSLIVFTNNITRAVAI